MLGQRLNNPHILAERERLCFIRPMQWSWAITQKGEIFLDGFKPRQIRYASSFDRHIT